MSGIESFEDAQAAVAELRELPAASGAPYNLDDLICLLCLSQHKEAEAGTKLPAPAAPVSVEADLGVALTSQERGRRLARKVLLLRTGEPGASQKQGARARRWPRWVWRRPSVATGTSALAAALPVLVRWLPVADASSLCQTCQRLHADGLFGPQPMGATRARVADAAAKMLFLQGGNSRHQRHGAECAAPRARLIAAGRGHQGLSEPLAGSLTVLQPPSGDPQMPMSRHCS